MVLCTSFGGFLFLIGRFVNTVVWGSDESGGYKEAKDLAQDKPKRRKAKPKKE